jgi:hypothetical protein
MSVAGLCQYSCLLQSHGIDVAFGKRMAGFSQVSDHFRVWIAPAAVYTPEQLGMILEGGRMLNDVGCSSRQNALGMAANARGY